MTHPIERFREHLDAVPDEAFPDCPERVDLHELEQAAGGPLGVAAFPVSHGLYAKPGWDHAVLPPFPAPGEGLMIVGNHSHSRAAALKRLREHGAHGDPDPGIKRMTYWRELYRSLDDAGIDRHRIFATNIHPAYFTATSGRVPRRGNEEWFSHALRFLALQVATMQPRLLLALGGTARDELARIEPEMPKLALNEPTAVTISGHRVTALHTRHPSAPGTTRTQRAEQAELLAAVWREDVS